MSQVKTPDLVMVTGSNPPPPKSKWVSAGSWKKAGWILTPEQTNWRESDSTDSWELKSFLAHECLKKNKVTPPLLPRVSLPNVNVCDCLTLAQWRDDCLSGKVVGNGWMDAALSGPRVFRKRFFYVCESVRRSNPCSTFSLFLTVGKQPETGKWCMFAQSWNALLLIRVKVWTGEEGCSQWFHN